MSTLRADAPSFVPSFVHDSPAGTVEPQPFQRKKEKRKGSRPKRFRNKPSQNSGKSKRQTSRDRRKVQKPGAHQGKPGRKVGENQTGSDGRRRQRSGNFDNGKSRRQIRSHDRHESARSISHVEEDLDSHFPSLVPPKDLTHEICTTQASSVWSSLARKAHFAEIQEQYRKQQEAAAASKSCSGVVLTPLGREKQKVNSEADASGRGSPTQVQYAAEEISVINRVVVRDMAKLRDRWWELMKQKHRKDMQEALERQQLNEEASILSESSTSYANYLVETGRIDDYDSEDESSVDEVVSYRESQHPLHDAILENDERSIQKLLATDDLELEKRVGRRSLGLDTGSLLAADSLSPLQLAVLLDRPNIIRLMLDTTPSLVRETESQNRTALMLAAELGFEGCLKVLLAYGASLLDKDAIRGDTALHYACRSGTSASLVRFIISSCKGNSSEQQKILACKNMHGQTPLHLACEWGHTHVVEVFLSTCSPSRLSKLLRLVDNDGLSPLLTAVKAESTDVVTSLLMWRGNHQAGNVTFSSGDHSDEDSGNVCPLKLAASIRSIEMVHLLLEFNDPASNRKGFDLDAALYAAVVSPTSEDRIDIIRVLVEAGASPIAPLGTDDSGGSHTALSLNACKDDAVALSVILNAFDRWRRAQQIKRRRDPKLLKQPETYFEAIELREEHALQTAISDATVRSLFFGWDDQVDSLGLNSSIVLMQKGAKLRDADVSRLMSSMCKGRIQMSPEGPDTSLLCYETRYQHYYSMDSDIDQKPNVHDRSGLSHWSDLLLEMPWMIAERLDTDCLFCPWMATGSEHEKPSTFSTKDEVILVAEEERFVVHGSIISAKSAKLAAAVRFARMTTTSSVSSSTPEIHVDLSSKMCKYFIQHIYHGSIITNLSSNLSEFSQDVLELSLVAEEFLCQSLIRECEMRLLAREPLQCFCWSCCFQVVITHPVADPTLDVTAECIYRLRGPSKLLTTENALDALAVCQQLAETKSHIRCFLRPVEDLLDDTWEEHSYPECILSTAFELVKAAAVDIILKQFVSVLKSDSYSRHLNDSLDSCNRDSSQDQEMQIMLLRMCLDELSDSPLLDLLYESSRVEKLAGDSRS